MRRLSIVVVVVGLVFAGLLTTPSAQAADTIRACVKKSSGAVKILTPKPKKCKKGWVKTAWNTRGPSGSNGVNGGQGPAGPNWVVKSADGVTLGVFAGFSFEPFQSGANPVQAPTLAALVYVIGPNGGIFRYYMDGTPYVDGIWFRDSGCTDAVLFNTDTANLKIYLRAAGSEARAVHWVTGAPVATAWRVPASSRTAFPVNLNTLYMKSTVTGTCSASGINAPGYGVQLASAPVLGAPGPVQIVR
ncbi:MAG: hypothetical protein U0R23_01790 [Candidatus Nanopelagicales bacterium]